MYRFLGAVWASVVLSASALGEAQSAPGPDLAVSRAFTPPASATAYAYDFVSEADGDEGGVTRGRYDPSKPKGQRFTILETTTKDSLKKIDERYEKRGGGNIWCDQAFGGADGAVTQRTDAAGASIYQFTPLPPKEGAQGGAEDLYTAMRADVVLDPSSFQVRSYRAVLAKPVRMMMVATANTATISGQCATAPNGRTYATRTEVSFAGSGMGQKISRRIVQTVSNLTPAG
jgi:hypothetical protein